MTSKKICRTSEDAALMLNYLSGQADILQGFNASLKACSTP
jgi:hypothetical protein